MPSTLNYKAVQRKAYNPHNKWSAIVFWSQGKGGNALANSEGYEYLYDTEEGALAAAREVIKQKNIADGIRKTNAAM